MGLGGRRGGRLAAVLIVAVLSAAIAPTADATAPYVRKLPPLLTPWTRSVSTVAPLPEYPRPQFERSAWLNLNGQWQYEQAQPGQPAPFGRNLAETILVPFPVQSPLSGIERGDTAGWYRRTFRVPRSWRGQHVLLNFGAVSWAANVYVNGRLAGTHRGDYTAFSLDISRLLRRGVNELVVGYIDPIGSRRRADRQAGARHPVGHPPHRVERDLADRVARAGARRASDRAGSDARPARQPPDRRGVGDPGAARASARRRDRGQQGRRQRRRPSGTPILRPRYLTRGCGRRRIRTCMGCGSG